MLERIDGMGIDMGQIKQLYKRHEELILYLMVGVLTTVVSLGVYYICVFCQQKGGI